MPFHQQVNKYLKYLSSSKHTNRKVKEKKVSININVIKIIIVAFSYDYRNCFN